MNILVINGPNLNLLHERNADIYGKLSLEDINRILVEHFPEVSFTFLQSNMEGEIVETIQKASTAFDGLVINPAAYSHYSLAIRDALELCKIPKIEVHLSNIMAREGFRHHSVTGAVCNGIITGLKELGYVAAVTCLVKLKNK